MLIPTLNPTAMSDKKTADHLLIVRNIVNIVRNAVMGTIVPRSLKVSLLRSQVRSGIPAT